MSRSLATILIGLALALVVVALATILIGLALALVVVALATGVVGFAKGGPWYRRHANRLMRLRVAAQALAVALLALLLWLGR